LAVGERSNNTGPPANLFHDPLEWIVGSDLKAIHAQESREAADQKARAIVDDLRTARMNTAADLVERSVSETAYGSPRGPWSPARG
jgi:hypothetical protein